MNLPAALEESDGESLPQSLKEKARVVRQVGGIDLLKSLIADLPSLLQRNKEILDEAERLLNEEKDSDVRAGGARPWGVRWKRFFQKTMVK